MTNPFSNIKPRIILAIFILPLAVIIAAVPENKTKKYKLSINELVGEFTKGIQYISTDEIADQIINKDPSIQLIDVRDKNSYDNFHLPNAISIPISDILNDEWIEILDQDVKANIFYSNGTVSANQAWIITRQLGYKNNYVMQGGLNYWAETIMDPKQPAQTTAGDEIAKYDFRKGASQALGGGAITPQKQESQSKPKIKIPTKKKKKRAQGGC